MEIYSNILRVIMKNNVNKNKEWYKNSIFEWTKLYYDNIELEWPIHID